MESIYKILICKRCGKTNILINDEVNETKKNDKYLACAHCGCKYFKREKETSDLRECMDHNAYKKVKGKVRQVHSI